jgi:FMN-dependent oxidoreductase (nitrilotriacetate monooxygenase family)
MMPGQMKLGVFLMGAGHHIAAWRVPEAPADAYEDIDFYRRTAQAAEAGKLDMLFVSDALSLTPLSHPSELVRFEPTTLVAALAMLTRRIGLIATVSTTYNEPYHVARRFASLDHLSKGRSGWNIVTSYYEQEAANFGLDRHPEHSERYRRADEFVRVVRKLWNSWEPDALVRDKEAGIYFDPGKLHAIEHVGEYYRVRGPLNASRSVQGEPVLIQAGSSPEGVAFAAKHAEVIFTAQQTLEQAQRFYANVKALVRSAGRSPDHVHILPGVSPVLGKSAEDAQARYQRIQELIPPDIGLAFLSDYLGGIDLSRHDLDGPLPDVIPPTNGNQSRRELIIAMARTEKLTIRQLYQRIAGSRGHRMIFGSPQEIADQLEHWFVHGGADGYNLMFPYYPGLLEEFVEEVVPILQARGLFRDDYTGSTLRDHLGLPVPEPLFQYERR